MNICKKTIKKLNKEILKCQKCHLRKSCKQVVPGNGSSVAEIMFIGEGPGAKEDEIGLPFVGGAGKFLDEMLATISLQRKEVYITNIVKCRPPKNRDPLPEEKDVCWQWLKKQIEIIKPKLIVTLGRHAMENFLPGQKISQCHGKAFRREVSGIGEQVFFTLYHPAAALYNGSMRKILIGDFKKIPKVIDLIKGTIDENR